MRYEYWKEAQDNFMCPLLSHGGVVVNCKGNQCMLWVWDPEVNPMERYGACSLTGLADLRGAYEQD